MDTIAALVAAAGDRFGASPALRFRAGAGWATMTYAELDTATSELARGPTPMCARWSRPISTR